jgi:hypothetical protein
VSSCIALESPYGINFHLLGICSRWETNPNRFHLETTIATLSPEIFEQVYLAPKPRLEGGDLRHTYGNSTPIAVVGLRIGLTPSSIELVGWNGAGGQTATV